MGQTTILNETFGTTNATLPAGWASSNTTNGWNGSTASTSNTYSGASAGANALFSATGTNNATHTLTYANNLSTVGLSNITIIWGARKTATYALTPLVEWSANGTTWNSISYTDVSANATWAQVNGGASISLPAGAEGLSNLRLRWTGTSTNNGNYRIDDVIVKGTAQPSIAISSAHPAAGNINAGSTNNIIASYQFVVTNSAATFTGMSVTTNGTYVATDLSTNGFKFWINTANNLTGATQLGSNQTSVGSGGTVAVSGLTQSMPVGTRYVLVTADIASNAVLGNTIGVTSTPFSGITFSSGNKTGTDPVAASNLQTILAPSVAISASHPAAGNINFNSTDNIIGSIQLDVTGVAGTLTGFSVTTSGTYTVADIQANGFKLWVNSTNNLTGATQLGTSQAAVGSGGTIAVTGLNQNIPIGTRYLLVTASISVSAVGGNTIGITSTPFSGIVFSSGNKTGTDPVDASNLQTIQVPSVAIAASHPAAGTVNFNSTDNIIGSIQMDVTAVAGTFTGITVTTSGTYTASDIQTNGFKFWINSSNTLTGATQLGTSQAAVGSGGTVSVSGLTQNLPISTRYILVTASISVGAAGGNTIGITSTPFSGITFTNAIKTGTDPVDASNLQTIQVPSIAIAASHPAAGTINFNTTNNLIGSIQFDVTTLNATLSGVSVTTNGTYTTVDISTNGFKFWINSVNSLSGATQLGSAQAAVGSGGTVAISGLSQAINAGTTRYLLVTADLSAAAVNNHTIGITSTPFSALTFTNGTKTGTDPVDASNLQTIFSSVGATTMVAGANSEPASISSLINTQGAAVLNFDVDIVDDGATPAVDALPTLITQMVFSAGTGNDVANWTLAIEGAELSDGTNSITGTVAASTITFSGINIADLGLVADDATKNYSLKVWLKADLTTLKNTIDGANLVFRIQTTNVTSDVSGSQLAASQDQNSGATNNAIDVQATALAFVQNTSNANVSVAMSPSVTVQATDANGNRDLGYSSVVSITSTGTLTGSPVQSNASSGLATFATLTHTVPGTGLQLTAASGVLSSVLSNTFNIIDVTQNADYFRSKASGIWGTAATWESSHDNSNWITATAAPSSAAASISILSSHTITLSSNVTVDDIVIANGGVLLVNSSTGTLNLNNGSAANDLVIENGGVLQVTGTATYGTTIIIATGAIININTGGKVMIGDGTAAMTGGGYGSFGSSSTGITWNDGAIFEWNTSGVQPATSGVTWFPGVGSSTIPVFRFTLLPSGSWGGSSSSIINGLAEVNYPLNWTGSGAKTFRNGIIGTGNMTQTTGSGNFSITGTTAQLGGSGTITLLSTGTLTIGSTTTCTLSSNKTINAGSTILNGTLVCGTNVLSGTTAFSSGASSIIHTENVGGINASITTTGRTLNATTSYVFNGSSAQNTGAALTNCKDFTLNNAAGVSLSGNLSLTGTLTFQAGKFSLGGSDLTIGSAGVISGANSTNYVVTNSTGNLIRNNIGTTATAFPIGDNSYYTPVIITNGGTVDNFSVNFNSGSEPGCLSPSLAVTGTWEITEAVAGGSSCGLSIDYGSLPSGASFVGATAKIGHCTGATLDYVNGTPSGTVVTGSGFTSFSPFGVTSETILPVELSNFSGVLRDRKSYLAFSTVSERNNAFFAVERATDGVHFKEIGKVNGAGDSDVKQQYSFVDNNPANGMNYYRLRQVDFDGDFMYSKVVTLMLGSVNDLHVSPSPAISTVRVSLDNTLQEEGLWQVYDLTGRQILSGTLEAETTGFEIDLSSLMEGNYILRLTSGQQVITRQFSKQ